MLFPSPFAFSLFQHPGVFQPVGSSHQMAKILQLQLQHPSNEHSGLISFRIDWFDLLAVQGTLKSLLQHHRSKASILWGSAFFMVQLSHPYRFFHKVKVKVAQLCPTLCNPMDYTGHEILEARILDWVAIPFSRGFSPPRD